MLLQQLLQRNHQNVRHLYLDQNTKKNLLASPNFPKRKPLNNSQTTHQKLKITLHQLLHNHPTQFDFNNKHHLVPTNINQPYLNVTLDTFKIDDFKTQRHQSTQFDINKHKRSHSIQFQRKSRLQSPQKKLSKTNLPFRKSSSKNSQSSYVDQRKTISAKIKHQSPKFNTFDKGIFELPESFTFNNSTTKFLAKNSNITSNKPRSTLINHNESHGSRRSESIHSRERMRKNQQIFKSRKAKSQQNFYVNDGSISQPVRKLTFLKDYQQKEFENEQRLLLEIGKINLHQKHPNRNVYTTVFSKYKKQNSKVELEELYSPWKKLHKNKNNNVDLTDLIQLHHY